MRMANAEFRAKRQWFEIHGIDLQAIGLTGRAINNIFSVVRPTQVGDVSLRLKRIFLFQRGDCEQSDGVVRPIAVNFYYAGKRFFVGAENRASITGERSLFAEFGLISLAFEPAGDAKFAGRLSGEWAIGRHAIVANSPKPQGCLLASRTCFRKIFFRSRPCQELRNDSKFAEGAEKYFPVQIERVKRRLPAIPGRYQKASGRRPRESRCQVLRADGSFIRH